MYAAFICPFLCLRALALAHAGFIVNRMMTRAIRLANPDDIERAAKNARRLLEARSNSDSAGGAGLLGLGTGSPLAVLGLGQSYNGGMPHFAQNQSICRLISGTTYSEWLPHHGFW